MIALNVTIFVQCINFIVGLYLLNLLLIRPIRTLVKERKGTMHNLESAIADLTGRAEAKMANYEEVLEKARQEGLNFHLTLRSKALENAKNIVYDAEQVAQQTLIRSNAEIAFEKEKAEKALQKEKDAFVDLVVQKVL